MHPPHRRNQAATAAGLLWWCKARLVPGLKFYAICRWSIRCTAPLCTHADAAAAGRGGANPFECVACNSWDDVPTDAATGGAVTLLLPRSTQSVGRTSHPKTCADPESIATAASERSPMRKTAAGATSSRLPRPSQLRSAFCTIKCGGGCSAMHSRVATLLYRYFDAERGLDQNGSGGCQVGVVCFLSHSHKCYGVCLQARLTWRAQPAAAASPGRSIWA